jgi:hypothetical protein
MALQRIWLMEIEALNEFDEPVELTFSSGEYISPEGIYYDNRIKQPALYTSSAFAGDLVKSGSRSAYGEAVLVNPDGELDYLVDYSLDGRGLTISLRDEFGNITPIIFGTVNNLTFSDTTISIRLRDPQEILNLDDPEEYYLGNNILPNGVEGVETDIQGKIKPKVFGMVRNADPYLVNTAQLVYQVQSLPINTNITAVYDRGVLILHHTEYPSLSALLADNIPSGKYGAYQGYFKLGSNPAGEVTCDVDTDVSLAGEVFSYLASRQGYATTIESIAELNTLGEVGIYLKDKKKTSEMLDSIAKSIGGYWVINADGSLSALQLKPPTNVPDISIFDYQILNINRTASGSGGNGLPVSSVTVKSDKVEKVQTDLAGSVSADRKARLAEQFRLNTDTLDYVKQRHPLSEDLVIETVLRNAETGFFLANRLTRLLSRRRDTVQVEVRLDETITPNIVIGNTVYLESIKLGYSSGGYFTILGFTLDARLSKATLFLWGNSSIFGGFDLLVGDGIQTLLVDGNQFGLRTEVPITHSGNHVLYDYLSPLAINELGEYLRTKL